MTYKLKLTSQFKKDFKRMKKRGCVPQRLKAVLDMLTTGEPLPVECQDHVLSGKYAGFRECHIQADWLLIYYIEADQLVLVCSRTGSHSDLF
jgi:mRNA interferase YafQ